MSINNSQKQIYLDWNSQGRLHPKCIERMQYSYINDVNPQSKHLMGYKSKIFLESIIEKFLKDIDADNKAVVFTSSASEANFHILKMFNYRFVSDIEHPSIRNFKDTHILPVDYNGNLNIEYLENQIKNIKEPFIVSYMLGNHETGFINDLDAVVKITKKYNGFIHTDAVQAVGRTKFSFNVLKVDYMTLATHKCGGPGGIGAIVYDPKAPMKRFYQ